MFKAIRNIINKFFTRPSEPEIETPRPPPPPPVPVVQDRTDVKDTVAVLKVSKPRSKRGSKKKKPN